MKAKPIPVPKGGFTSNEDEARWLADTIAMRARETLMAAAGISSNWPTDGLYELLLKCPGAAARRARKEAGKERDAARQQGYREAIDAAVAASEVGLWPSQIYREVASEIQEAIAALTPEDKTP